MHPLSFTIKPYEPGDHDAGRSLWVELTEHHRHIYEDPSIGGDDPGAAFDRYLANPILAACFVADSGGAAGFRALGHLQLTMDLRPRLTTWRSGMSIHDVDFGW